MNIFHRKHQLPVQKSISLAQKSLIQNYFPGLNLSLRKINYQCLKNLFAMFEKNIFIFKNLFQWFEISLHICRKSCVSASHFRRPARLQGISMPTKSIFMAKNYFYANEKHFYASKKYLHAKENRLICCWMEVWQIICWEVTMSNPQSTESLVLRLLTCLIML